MKAEKFRVHCLWPYFLLFFSLLLRLRLLVAGFWDLMAQGEQNSAFGMLHHITNHRKLPCVSWCISPSPGEWISRNEGQWDNKQVLRSNSSCLGDNLPVPYVFLPFPSLIPSLLILFSFLHHPPSVLHLLAAGPAPYSTAHLSWKMWSVPSLPWQEQGWREKSSMGWTYTLNRILTWSFPPWGWMTSSLGFVSWWHCQVSLIHCTLPNTGYFP